MSRSFKGFVGMLFLIFLLVLATFFIVARIRLLIWYCAGVIPSLALCAAIFIACSRRLK